MKSKHTIANFFDAKGMLIVILGLVFVGFYLLVDFGSTETDTRKYEIRCLDDNGLYYHFFKTKDEWWITAHGTLVVKDYGRRYTFERRRCTYKPTE